MMMRPWAVNKRALRDCKLIIYADVSDYSVLKYLTGAFRTVKHCRTNGISHTANHAEHTTEWSHLPAPVSPQKSTCYNNKSILLRFHQLSKKERPITNSELWSKVAILIRQIISNNSLRILTLTAKILYGLLSPPTEWKCKK